MRCCRYKLAAVTAEEDMVAEDTVEVAMVRGKQIFHLIDVVIGKFIELILHVC